MDRDFIQARIDAAKLQIMAYEAAVDALVVGGVQSYTLDTGQNRQTVTRLDLKSIQEHIDSLLNRCTTLEARLNGATITGRPCW